MEYKLALNKEKIARYIENFKLLALDIETSPLSQYRNDEKSALDAHKSTITGMSFSVSKGSGIYVPFHHKVGLNADFVDNWDWIKQNILMNENLIVVIHNAAFETMFFYALGCVPQCKVYDTLAAAQMTLKTQTEFRKLADSGLKKLVPELLNIELPSFKDVTQGVYFDMLDSESFETIRYACADSDYALQLYYLFNKWFDENMPKHRFIVEQIESPTAVYVGLMKYNGVHLDLNLMHEKGLEAGLQIDQLKEDIAIMTDGASIGANASTKAFKDYLYKTLGLPVLKTTEKFSEAVDDEALILLSEWCEQNRPELVPIFQMIAEYRKWNKLKSTYISGYLKFLNTDTKRIHPDLMPLATETGRFASRNANLQNCFDDKTEILTKRGFVLFSELRNDDEVAQWENGEIEFVKPMEIISQNYEGELIQITNQHINLCMTPEHRCLLKSRKSNKWTVVSAKDYLMDARQLHAGQYHFGKKKMNIHQIIILCATQADGNYRDGGIEFSFSKERKYYRLKYALDVTKTKYGEGFRKSGQYRIRIMKGPLVEWIKSLLGDKKCFGKWLLNYDRNTVKTILDEIQHWDGCFTRSNFYSSSVKENVDWMQILYVLTGTRAHLREYWNKNSNSAINYQLDITDSLFSQTANAKKEVFAYKGKVYCVSVPSEFIVVRRFGQVCITGNCPRKDNDPIGIRKFIAAPKGKMLISLDFSQIELRVGAFYCRDEKMLETYRNNGDIHAQTTSVIFNIPFSEAIDKGNSHYKERRTIAKNCNFGVFYGLFPKGLQRTLKFKAGLSKSIDECYEIISNLKAGYKGLEIWQRKVKRQAAEDGYTETYLGRRRYLPSITSADWAKKSFAQRCALNTPIQGTAADILKLAMGRIIKGLSERLWLKPLLQVHDELIFEVPEDKVNESVEFVKSCMEQQPFEDFDVPIIAEAEVGKTFGTLHEI